MAYLQLDDENSNKTHVLLEHGKAQVVPENKMHIGESAKLSKQYNFTILSLDTSGQGSFKSKQYSRQHLSDMYNLYDDIEKIRNQTDINLIMVGNNKLIKHTGDLNSEPIQALIGMAIKKKALPFKFKDDHSLA